MSFFILSFLLDNVFMARELKIRVAPDIRPAGYPAGYPAFFAIRYPAGYPVTGTGYPAGYPAGRIPDIRPIIMKKITEF